LDARSPDPDELRAFREQTLYRLVLRARRAENAEMVARIRARGYPDLLPSYPTLLANLDSEGANMTVLAAKSGITRQAASQQLAEIEARGYVELRPDPSDGRAVIVDRTERGRRLLQDALEVVNDMEDGYAKQVGRKRFVAMKQVLSELLDAIDPAGRLDKA
jgi:DNA-binding MarR family transcriptional regulator